MTIIKIFQIIFRMRFKKKWVSLYLRILIVLFVLLLTIKYCKFNDKNLLKLIKEANQNSLPKFNNDQVEMTEKPFNDELLYLETINNSETKKEPFNIFMVETNMKSKYLNLKQLCTIESNALHNPEATVNLVSLGSKIGLQSLFKIYPNIKWSLLNIEELFEGTSLEKWWKSDQLTRYNEYYRISHLSDAVRIAIIYKNGGFYSDLDHIAIKNFQPLTNLSVLINNPTSIHNPIIELESSFFHLKKNHKFLKLAISEFVKNYDGSSWSKNGPNLLRNSIIKYCNTTNLFDLLISDRKEDLNKTDFVCDMNILPYFIAYPIHWSEGYKYFEPNAKIEIKRFLRAYTVHFITSQNRKYNITGGDFSIIEFLMAHHCPVVYEIIKNSFHVKMELQNLLGEYQLKSES